MNSTCFIPLGSLLMISVNATSTTVIYLVIGTGRCGGEATIIDESWVEERETGLASKVRRDTFREQLVAIFYNEEEF